HHTPLPTYPFQHHHYWLDRAAPLGQVGAHTEPEARLWRAIEDSDVAALTDTLQLDDEAAEALRPALPALSAWRRQQREDATLDSWRYHVTWRQIRPASATGVSDDPWLLVVPASHAGSPAVEATVQALDNQSVTSIRLLVDAPRTSRELIAAQLEGIRPTNVLSLLALDEQSHVDHEAVPAGLSATTALIQAMEDRQMGAPLWCVTQGAVAVNAMDPLTNPIQAQVWGLGRVAALEHPRRW
nr:type I polyketide synthase [Micromonospora sp. DSM 115978]